MKLLTLSFLLVSCATAPRDFREGPPPMGQARVYVYRPHQFETMWGKYEISAQGKPVKILHDEGYFPLDLPPGKLELRSHHVSDKEVVALDLQLEENRSYYVKLDPESEKFTVLGTLSDVLAVSTMVAGAVARTNIEAGHGTLGDVGKVIQGESAKASLKPKRSLGHHVLLAMEESAARREIRECCSSEGAEEIAGGAR